MTSRRTALRFTSAALALSIGAGAVACGSSGSGGGSTRPVDPNAAEVSPAGDIPDNQAFVPYSPPGGGYTVKVPEGWSRSARGGAVTFTDKLNSITMESRPLASAPTVRSVETAGLTGAKVTRVSRTAGPAIRTTYLTASKPNPVTGKSSADAVERYEFYRGGKEVVLTLSGPKGADNVDPWRIVTDSFAWSA